MIRAPRTFEQRKRDPGKSVRVRQPWVLSTQCSVPMSDCQGTRSPDLRCPHRHCDEPTGLRPVPLILLVFS
ncbi:unnamed protein product [Mycena citricolor]|uniref:Uncharacterized protein n=1 Tax=Mycena citricolor TaxID=2018698 RepID=A0AAD2JU41_9AGAR|nr:unnamed protein product [Mycena citricolor]